MGELISLVLDIKDFIVERLWEGDIWGALFGIGFIGLILFFVRWAHRDALPSRKQEEPGYRDRKLPGREEEGSDVEVMFEKHGDDSYVDTASISTRRPWTETEIETYRDLEKKIARTRRTGILVITVSLLLAVPLLFLTPVALLLPAAFTIIGVAILLRASLAKRWLGKLEKD